MVPARELFSRIARYGGASLMVAFAVAYFVWRPLSVSGPPLGDFSAYYAAGSVWSHGGDPYSTAVWSVERTLPGADPAKYEMLPYVGPPLGLPLWAALALLPYAWACAVWGLFGMLCVAAILIVPARLARRRLGLADAAALLVLAAACGPLVDGMMLGQAALPAVAAVAMTIVAAARARWIAVGAWAALAALFKPNLVVALAALLREPLAAASLAGAAVVSALGNLAAAGGARGIAEYLALLPQMTASERFYAYQLTPAAIAFGFGADRHAAVLAGTVVAVTVVAAVVLAVRWSRASLPEGALIACAALPLIVPYVHEPDLAAALLPALLVVYRARGAVWATGACALVVLAVDAFALAQGHAGLAFAAITALVAALEAAALGSAIPLRIRLVPLGVAAFVLGLGLCAPPRTLPMWPGAIPRHFTPAPGAPANQVWRDELVSAGLERQRRWVALLRCFTLGGCVLGGVALTADVRRRSRAPVSAPTFLVPRGAEAAAVRRGAPGARIITIAAGAACTRALPEFAPDERIVVLGLCGGLRELRAGDVALYARVALGDASHRVDDTPALALDGAHVVTACTVDHVVTRRAERRALAERFGADAVDMESAYLVAALAARGCTPSVARVVSDDARRDMPALDGAIEGGRVRPLRVAAAFVRDPRGAWAFVRDARRALRRLQRLATALANA